MRVLFVTPYYKPAYVYGGPAKSVPMLCEGLAALGVTVSVFTTNANGAKNLSKATFSETISGVAVTYFQRSVKPVGRYFYSTELGHACRTRMKEYDLAYLCGPFTYPPIPARRAALRSGVPYVFSPRGTLIEWCLQQKMLKKKLYLEAIERHNINNAEAVHCTSQIESEQYQALGFAPEPIMIPNGLDVTPFATKRKMQDIRSLFGIPPSAPLTIYVGRLQKEKRVPKMIQAFSEVARRVPESHFLIVGPDEDEVGVQARRQVAQLQLGDRVHFAGQISTDILPDYYAAADLKILISHTENFGMAAVEAMASSVAVLVSHGVGVAAEIERAGAGAVVDADSPGLESTWVELLRSPEQRKRMGECGRTLAMTRFSTDAVARKMLALFENVIEMYKR